MALCSGIKRDGGRCAAPAAPGSPYCYLHDPAKASERQRNAARGGKARVSRRGGELWDEVRQVITDVLDGSIQPPQANSALRGFGTLIELVKLDIDQQELEIAQRRLQLDEQERLELVAELEELRDMVEASTPSRAGNGRGWHG